MPRVMIVGPCGAGKSTFARRLGQALRLPVIHMDRLAWSPGWTMTPRASYDAALRASLAGDDWILDGNTSKPDVHQAADTVIFLDFPRWLYGCPEWLDWEFLEYVWNYRDAVRPKVLKRLKRLATGNRLIVLSTPAQAEAFFAQAEEVVLR